MIDKQLIFVEQKGACKKDVMETVFNQLEELHYINNRTLFEKDIYDREAVMPTAIGFGVAIPHAKSSSVNKPFITFYQAVSPFKWNEDDEEASDLIFMIGVPEFKGTNNLHLKILSQISKQLTHSEFREKLRNSSKEEVYQLLHTIDQNIERNCL